MGGYKDSDTIREFMNRDDGKGYDVSFDGSLGVFYFENCIVVIGGGSGLNYIEK